MTTKQAKFATQPSASRGAEFSPTAFLFGIWYNRDMQKLAAIILASRDVGEFDRIYTMYSREAGLVRAAGRGARKQTAKLAGHLEPGTLAEVYIARSRGMGQITSAIALENFPRVKNNFGILDGILKIFRFFTGNFSEGEKDERIFDLLAGLLENLEKRKGGERILTEAFWWKLFDLLGHRPGTMKCAKCGVRLSESEKKFFSVPGGGIICEKCPAGESGLNTISSNQTKLLRIFLANPLEKALKVKIDEGELEGLERIRQEFLRYNF